MSDSLSAMFNAALSLSTAAGKPEGQERSLIADEIDALNLPVKEYTAKGMRAEIYFVLHTQFKNSMPFFCLKRGNRRPINVFSLTKYTLRARDEFSITCYSLLYLNLRLHAPSIGNITELDKSSDEDILDLPLIMSDPLESRFGVRRRKRYTMGRTVIQFPFSIDDNTVDRVLSVIEAVLCSYDITACK